MIEFVLCIPLLGFLLVVTFFFGWAMANQQEVKISGRYAAWSVARGKGAATPEYLNSRFFSQKAAPISILSGDGPDGTLHNMVDGAGAVSADAQMVADHLVLARFPRGSTAEVAARFPTDVGLWKRLEGAIRHRHAREGVEWRRRQADCEEVVRDDFLMELDSALQSVASSQPGGFGDILRILYNQKW